MDKIEVTQADRLAAWEHRPSCYKVDDYTNWMAGKYDFVAAIIKGFAAHRATRTDATPVAWMYYAEDGQEATQPLKNRLVPNTMGWTEAPLFTHPPATDVAALVEAAKKIMPIRVNDGPDYAEVYFADGEKHSTHAMTMNPQDWMDLSAALAPFTKGQPDA